MSYLPGAGEGEGKKDVSDQITDEEQVSQPVICEYIL